MAREGTVVATDPSQLVSSLFALFPIPVAVIDDQGRVLIANSAFGDVFPGVQNTSALPQHEMHVSGRGTYEMETLPLSDQGLRIFYATEVTNEVQLRHQVIHLEKMAAIGRLVSGATHELNNSLSGVLGYAQVLSRSDLDGANQRMSEMVLEQAQRAERIVQDVLCLSVKSETKRIALDLNQVVRNAVQHRDLDHRADERIKVTLDPGEDLPQTLGDPHQIEQVLLSLIINAEDAITSAPPRAGITGNIHIRTLAEGPHLHLTVTDNGAGIHSRDMSRIFDPFFTTKVRQRRPGLGLSICSEIIKDHGGELYAWSAYGQGSTFTLELPICQLSDTEDTPADKASRGQLLRGKSILVIDDEIHITELIFDVLTRQGARLDLAHSGAAALEHIRKKQYDVVICDQRMPGLSGQKLFKLVESLNPALRHRFLFVTGDVVNAQAKTFFAQAGVQYLRKPFRMQDLVDSVESVVSRNQPQGS